LAKLTDGYNTQQNATFFLGNRNNTWIGFTYDSFTNPITIDHKGYFDLEHQSLLDVVFTNLKPHVATHDYVYYGELIDDPSERLFASDHAAVVMEIY
jgi:IS1 family transposase